MPTESRTGAAEARRRARSRAWRRPSSRWRWWPAGALSALALVTLAAATGCGGSGGDPAPGGDLKTLSRGKLRVGSDVPYVPFEFGSPPHYQGFDVDIVNELGGRLGLDPEWVKSPFDPIFRNLAAGRFDMVASGATITPERERTVDFSDPYLPGGLALMVRRGSDIANAGDLKGRVIGALSATPGAHYARDRAKARRLHTYDYADDVMRALEAGLVQAVLIDYPVAKYAERTRKKLQVVATIPAGRPYGLAFHKDGDVLRGAVDRALGEMKSDGAYAKIYEQWFRSAPPAAFTGGGDRGTGADRLR